MEPTELRVKNFYKIKSPEKTTWQDSIILCNYYMQQALNNEINIKPIKLTEKWLIDFGFKKVDKNKYILPVMNKGRICAYLKSDIEIELENYNGDGFGYPKVSYVHQLQNLYHSLTGKELKVKK